MRWLLLLVLMAGLGWIFRDADPVRQLTKRAAGLATPPALPQASTAPHTAGAGLRKCVKDGQVLYTNGACPPGSRVEAVDNGAVTVVPAQAVPASPSGAVPSASAPTVLERLAPPDPNLGKNSQTEAAMQR